MKQNNRSNIILVGFMASGKSRVGEMLAKRLGYDLLDIDAIIEKQQHEKIKDIFAKHGEWYFRKLETDAIKNLRHREHAVIVTGGGAPMCFENAQMLKQMGQIFYLDANLALILQRLAQSDDRPLGSLTSLHDLEKIKALYIYRRPIFLSLGYFVDVNHENKAIACDEIIERFKAANRLTKLPKTTISDAAGTYEIFHKEGVLNAIGDICLSLGLRSHRVVIITTEKLREILSQPIKIIRDKIQSNVEIITFGDGEHHKNLTSVEHIHEQMFSLQLNRKTLILALGGGNVGDVAGFAASIFLRGVPFIQIPTTLLAMVDASIGGKTGVDVKSGKNLIGAFYNPKAVIIDPNLLNTLAEDDFSCGMAEIIKSAIISDRALFFAMKNGEISLSEMIERALKVKALIVLADPRENNIRAHLNLGHTFAHAIELVSGYEIKHGAAVAMGLLEATKLARTQRVLEEDFIDDLEFLLQKFSLPTSLPPQYKKSDLLAAMKFDKKRDENGLKFILPKRIGSVCIHQVDERDVWA